MNLPIVPPELPNGKTKGFRSKIFIGVAVGWLFEVGGYLFLRGNQTAFGWVMFIIVPAFMGFAISLFTETKRQAFWGIFGALVFGLAFLILEEMEGWICCVLASPLLMACAFIGASIGQIVRTWLLKMNIKIISKFLMLGIAMLFIVGAKAIEKPYLNSRLEIFNSSVSVPVTPEKAWDLIKSVERIDTHKPLLLAIGLPLPKTCTLDKEGVGGKRVCYFDQGIIAQEISEWNPPHFMKTKITASTLPGRHWLKFVDASYEFLPQDGKTLVIRTTTISSRLYPRWYWRQFEEYGVRSEHEYVLSDLVRRAELESK
jgi:hypothetical protein